jgi:hypothetical protein
MTDLPPGKIGAKRQSWMEFNPRSVLRAIMKQSPNASEKEIHDAVKVALFEDTRYLEAIFESWFANNYRSFEVITGDNTVAVLKRQMRKAQHDRLMAHIGKRHAEFTHGILMDMQLSCGKLLREAHGSDLDKETGFLGEVRKHVKSNQIVGRALTEQQLSNLWSRHYAQTVGRTASAR